MMRHKLSRGNSKGKQQGGGKLEPGKQQMKSSSSSRRRESHLGKAWMGKREAHLGSLLTSVLYLEPGGRQEYIFWNRTFLCTIG